MAKIATCPQCAAQLGLSDETALNDRLECPECKADFLLGETIQIALPVARVLPKQVEPSAEATRPTLAETVQTETETAVSKPTTSSWEERLKNAIATDAEQQPADSSSSKSPPQEPATLSPPSFELELDLETSAKPEPVDAGIDPEPPKKNPLLEGIKISQPKSEPQRTAPLTLADFAAQAESQPVELELPDVALESVDRLLEKTHTATEQVVEKLDTPQPVAASLQTGEPEPLAKPSPSCSLKGRGTDEKTLSTPRPVVKRGFPKVAAFAVGPLAGSLLGLYGLLWLQGPQADYVGMSKVLPQSMLPTGFKCETTTPAEEESSLAAARDLMQKPQPIKRDSAVQPATAFQPLTDRSTLQEFTEAFAAAETAAPAFLEGDLSQPESVQRKGQAYMALCGLAEHFDFANQPGLAPLVLAKIEQAKQMYGRVSNDAATREQLSHIASRWWEYDQRSNQGMFFTGTVQAIQPAGNNTLYQVSLNSSEVIPVLVKNAQYRVGDSVGIVGKVVTDPQEIPTGVESGAKKVVAAAYSYLLK